MIKMKSCKNCVHFPCARYECDIKNEDTNCEYFKSLVLYEIENPAWKIQYKGEKSK